MARLHLQFQEICDREATEQELRNDLKTVWSNHSSQRRLDINVKFSRQRPTPPLMLMPPSASEPNAPSVYESSLSPPWTTPNSYFVSLPLLPTDAMMTSNSSRSDEPPDDIIDRYDPSNQLDLLHSCGCFAVVESSHLRVLLTR
jgi:hypothetical protein